MDNYYFSAACLASLQRHLPNARFVDATGLVNWQRAVKSSREIEYMRRAARIVEAMHARILELVEPGCRKNRLIAEIYHTAINGADGFGGDYPAIVPLAAVRPRCLGPAPDLGRPSVQAGEGTFFEIAGCYQPLPLPALAHDLARQAAAEVPRHREGGAGGNRRGTRRGAGPARPARTSRRPGARSSPATASRRRAAAATRSASATRRTGASAP